MKTVVEGCESCRGTGIALDTHNSVAPKDVPLCKSCKGLGEIEYTIEDKDNDR